MEHSQKALLPPLQSLQLSSLLTMKGGNLSQLNDYPMTHPKCGENKHWKMPKKKKKRYQDKLDLSAIFLAQVTNMLFSFDATSGQPDWKCQATVFLVFLVFEMFFPHRYKQSRLVKMEDKMWINPNSLQQFRNMHTHDSAPSSVETDISARWRVETPSKVQCTVADNVCAQLWHIIERPSAETGCFCRILSVPAKEMTQWYKAGAHSWSSLITHMSVRGSRSSLLDSRLPFWARSLADCTVWQQH